MKKLTKIVAALAIAALTLSLTSCENSSKTYIYNVTNQVSGDGTEIFVVTAYFSERVSYGLLATLTGKESECDAAATTRFNEMMTSAGISQDAVKALSPNTTGYFNILLQKKELGASGDYTTIQTVNYTLGGNQ